MRSTLKKSLYLGLAALSFASVAGAANNADAAKKTKPAKTYATASYQNIPDQGQSNVAYNVTGSNALFNKPGTVKGAKQTASKATMSDLASSKQNFMVYQTATTNRGSKYIKVVSFDKQYRGWIYAGNNTSAGYGTGVQQINLATSASPQYSSVYLKNPGNVALKTSPEGSQFNASQNSFAQTGLVAGDKFSVDTAQTVSRTGTTWYHLVDQNNSTINGWVPSDQVQLGTPNYFDKNNDIQVNYTDNGNVVKTSYVPVNTIGQRSGYASGIKDPQSVANVISSDGFGKTGANTGDNSSFSNGAYNLVNGLNTVTDPNNASNQVASDYVNSAFGTVQVGNTVNVPVKSNKSAATSKLNFNVTNGVNAATSLNTSNVYMPSLTTTMQNTLGGNNYQNVPTSLFDVKTSNGLFGNDGNASTPNSYNNANSNNPSLQTLYGKDQTTDHDINGVNGSNQSVTIKQGTTFYYKYTYNQGITSNINNGKTFGQDLNVYYDATPVLGSSGISSSNSSINNTSYLK